MKDGGGWTLRDKRRREEVDVGGAGTEIERTGCRNLEIEGRGEKSRGIVGRTGIGRERGRGRGMNMCGRKDDK